jgi:hypothetical protein
MRTRRKRLNFNLNAHPIDYLGTWENVSVLVNLIKSGLQLLEMC